jgi:hypothetical protein
VDDTPDEREGRDGQAENTRSISGSSNTGLVTTHMNDLTVKMCLAAEGWIRTNGHWINQKRK